MKKSDLKQLIKPLVKECIHEVLVEEGLLANVVSEVAKGLQQNVIVETKQKQPEALFNENLQMQHKTNESRTKLHEHRKKLLDAIGQDAYNGVDLFEGTTPVPADSQPGSPMAGTSPNDPGVDISSLLGNQRVWKALASEKK